MAFSPIWSHTEDIVDRRAGYMEYDLEKKAGYAQWQGLFDGLGPMGRLFNGYMVQPADGDLQISGSPVELHLFDQAIYIAPPFEYRDYYVEIRRAEARRGRIYFRAPAALGDIGQEKHKPLLEDLLAVDIWSESGDSPVQLIHTLYFEARVETGRTIFEFGRFTREQLSRYQGHEGGTQ